MAGSASANIQAGAGLAADDVLFLVHDARHVAQGVIKIQGVLELNLLFGEYVELCAEAGHDRHGGRLIGHSVNGYRRQGVRRQAAFGERLLAPGGLRRCGISCSRRRACRQNMTRGQREHQLENLPHAETSPLAASSRVYCGVFPHDAARQPAEVLRFFICVCKICYVYKKRAIEAMLIQEASQACFENR
mgnify:CR=1 FL=1